MARSRLVFILAVFLSGYLALAVWFAADDLLSRPHAVDFGAALTALGTIVLLAIGAGVARACRHFRAGTESTAVLAPVLGIGFALQLFWGGWVDPQPFAEFGTLWDQARRLATSFDVDVLYSTASPSAVGVYALGIAVFGEDLMALRIISAFLWTAQAFLVWKIATRVRELRDSALVAALCLAFSPAVIVFSSLPSAEAVFGVFALTAVYLLLSHRRRGLYVSAALAGLAAALAFLCKPVALAYFIGVLIVLGVAVGRAAALGPRLRLAGGVLACLAGFAVGVAPQALLNHAKEGQFSIAPAPAIGYQLLLGTNRDSGGAYSVKDLEQAGYIGPDQTTLLEADRRAREIAWSRVSSDPGGFIVFAFTEKMRRLWSSEVGLLDWSVGSSPRGETEPMTTVTRWGGVVIDAAYLAILIAAMAGVVRLAAGGGAVHDPARWLLVLGVLTMLALAHFMLEVRPRYHLAFTPMLALLVPLGLSIPLRRPRLTQRSAPEDG
ncbi:MAG: glycosyltransferase family 39 protein [Pseudomonadota bacterium]